MNNRAYPEISLALRGKDLDHADRWLAELERRGEIEIVRDGKRWTIGGFRHRHVTIRLIVGQLNLLQRYEPDQPAMVLGGGINGAEA